VKRYRHPLTAVALALLLLAAQVGSQLHALEHTEEALKLGSHRAFCLPAEDACPLCALFAGTANALPSGLSLDTPSFFGEPPLAPAPRPAAREVSRFYDSRAPPASA